MSAEPRRARTADEISLEIERFIRGLSASEFDELPRAVELANERLGIPDLQLREGASE